MIPIVISMSATDVQRPHDSGDFPRQASKRSKEATKEEETRTFIAEHGLHPDDDKAPKKEEEPDPDKEEDPTTKPFSESDLADMSGSQIQDLHDSYLN